MKLKLANTVKQTMDISNVKLEDIKFGESTVKKQFEVLKKLIPEGCYKLTCKNTKTTNAPNGYQSEGMNYTTHQIDTNSPNITRFFFEVIEQINLSLEKFSTSTGNMATYTMQLNGDNSYIEVIEKITTNGSSIGRVFAVSDDESFITILGTGLSGFYETGKTYNYMTVVNKVAFNTRYLFSDSSVIDDSETKAKCDLSFKPVLELKSLSQVRQYVIDTFDGLVLPMSLSNEQILNVWSLILNKWKNNTSYFANGSLGPNDRNKEGNFLCGYRYATHINNTSSVKLSDMGITDNEIKNANIIDKSINEIVVYGINCLSNKNKVNFNDKISILSKWKYYLVSEIISDSEKVGKTIYGIMFVSVSDDGSETQSIVTDTTTNNNGEFIYFDEGYAKENTYNLGTGIVSETNTINTSSSQYFNINPRDSNNTNQSNSLTDIKSFTEFRFD
jgi:hypothetical protein